MCENKCSKIVFWIIFIAELVIFLGIASLVLYKLISKLENEILYTILAGLYLVGIFVGLTIFIINYYKCKVESQIINDKNKFQEQYIKILENICNKINEN